MKKRFTDSDIWDDPWFRKLPCTYKEFWRYLCDKCDAAGVWKVDMENATFFIGELLDPNKALELYNAEKDGGDERVQVISPERWWITGFISFQYGVLSPACRPHAHVLALCLKHGIKGYTKGIDTFEDKDREQDKDKEQERGGSGGPCPHQEIISLYHKTLPELAKVKEWTDARQAFLRSRWLENPERQALAWWDGFFKKVKCSDFLCGRKTDFKANLEWLIRPTNFIKVLEGNYDNRRGGPISDKYAGFGKTV